MRDQVRQLSAVSKRELAMASQELTALAGFVGKDKREAARALVGNLDQLVVLALNREREWVSRGETVTTHDPDVAAAAKCYELSYRVLCESPPDEDAGDLSTWQEVCRRAVADPKLRAEMERALERAKT